MRILCLIAALWLSLSLSAQDLHTYSFEQVDSLQADDRRATVVFLHADWCRYCRAMEQRTFSDERVIQKLNERFYFVSFDGESQEPVRYQSVDWPYEPTGRSTGTHSLAKALGTIDGKLDYPTLTILSEEHEIVFQHSGFLTAEEVLKVLERI